MRPLIFLSFANQMDDYLATLKRESQNINDALKGLHDQGAIEIYREESVEIRLLLDGINRFRERITIFHYAGHAGDTALEFEDGNANAKGLAQLLGALPNLQLVVLNGCSTQGQVDYLLQQGVKAVIATNSPINDTKATEFATEFYSSLAKHHTVEIAFKFAVNALKTKYGGEDMATIIQFRGFGAKPEAAVFPWGLYLNKDINKVLLDWKLPSAPLPENNKKVTPILLTNPPFDSDFFLGREKDLDDIEAEYQKKNRLLVLVNGEGGIGKTTLTAKYWYKHAERYKHLAWLYADTGIGNALVTLKDKLGVEFEQNDTLETQVTRITEAINNLETPCLLVFDNANDDADLKKYYTVLKRLANCHVLLTSRVNKLDELKVHRIAPLTETESIELFKHYYSAVANSELPLLKDVLKAVGYNTLVTEVLAKNMAVFNKYTQKYSLTDLLHDLQAKGLLALKNKAITIVYGSDSLREAEPTDIIAAMYDLAKLNDAERYLLSNLSVLPAENIAYTLLESLLGMEEDKLEAALSSLENKGWLEYRKQDNTFKVSPVVQGVVRSKNKEGLWNDCEKLVSSLNDNLDRNIIHEDNYKYSTELAYYAEYILSILDSPIYDLANLAEKTGNVYYAIGHWDKSIKIVEQCLDISEKVILLNKADERIRVLQSSAICWLGMSHSELGHFSKSLDYFEKFNDLEKELCSIYPLNLKFKHGLVISYEKLGDIHCRLGNLDKALIFFNESVKLGEDLYYCNLNDYTIKYSLAISYGQLGNAYTMIGDFKKALLFSEKTTVLFNELITNVPNDLENQISLATSYEKLGSIHSYMGNETKSLEFFQKYNQLGQKLYSIYPKNVTIKNGLAISYSKLGGTYCNLGQLKNAVDSLKEFNLLEKELYNEYLENTDFKSNYAESLSVLWCTHKYLDTSFDNNWLNEAIQLFEELYSSMQTDYYSKKIAICKKMKEDGADLRQLISEMSAF